MDLLTTYLTIRREGGDREGEGSTLTNLALLADRLGNGRGTALLSGHCPSHARLATGGENGPPSTIWEVWRMIWGRRRSPTLLRAGPVHPARDWRPGREGRTLTNLGMLAFRLGQTEEARRYYQQALALFQEIGAVVLSLPWPAISHYSPER